MAAASAIKPGIKAVVYRNTGTYGSPTWTECEIVRDAQAPKPWDLQEASTRASRVKLYHPTQQDFQATLTVRADDADTDYLALQGAADEGTVLDLLIMDGPNATEGSRGVRAHFHVSETGNDQSIGAIIYKTYELKPGFSSDGTPKYVVAGASSALTFSDPG